MLSKNIRNIFITIFVIMWCFIYHYMSVKHFYLQPHFDKPLPRVPMLFPPAGWIMFYKVDDAFGEAQVYGIKGVNIRKQGNNAILNGREYYLIDQHDIFRTRTIFFDNIKRGLIHGAVRNRNQFCTFLEYRFPEYDAFELRYLYYPAMTKEPDKKVLKLQYQCLTQRYIENERR